MRPLLRFVVTIGAMVVGCKGQRASLPVPEVAENRNGNLDERPDAGIVIIRTEAEAIACARLVGGHEEMAGVRTRATAVKRGESWTVFFSVEDSTQDLRGGGSIVEIRSDRCELIRLIIQG